MGLPNIAMHSGGGGGCQLLPCTGTWGLGGGEVGGFANFAMHGYLGGGGRGDANHIAMNMSLCGSGDRGGKVSEAAKGARSRLSL